MCSKSHVGTGNLAASLNGLSAEQKLDRALCTECNAATAAKLALAEQVVLALENTRRTEGKRAATGNFRALG